MTMADVLAGRVTKVTDDRLEEMIEQATKAAQRDPMAVGWKHWHWVAVVLELKAARARIAELEADAVRLNWLEANPRLSIIKLEGEPDQDCYLYGVAGAPGLKLREILDAARGAEVGR